MAQDLEPPPRRTSVCSWATPDHPRCLRGPLSSRPPGSSQPPPPLLCGRPMHRMTISPGAGRRGWGAESSARARMPFTAFLFSSLGPGAPIAANRQGAQRQQQSMHRRRRGALVRMHLRVGISLVQGRDRDAARTRGPHPGQALGLVLQCTYFGNKLLACARGKHSASLSERLRVCSFSVVVTFIHHLLKRDLRSEQHSSRLILQLARLA